MRRRSGRDRSGHAGRDAGLDLAVRCGGHNGPGLGSVDDGLVIDLSALRGVIVDPERRVAHVLGGTLLGEVDHATQPFGLAAPFGIISTTGVGGLSSGAVSAISPADSGFRLTT